MLKDRVVKAYAMAKIAHEGQFRKYNGHPYFVHPKAVARKIEDLTKDEDLVIAALLHDAVEDCGIDIIDIQAQFGDRVARLVNAVTSDKKLAAKGKAVYLTDKMLKMELDELLLKLVDRYDNVDNMDKDCKTTEHKQFVKKYSIETRYIIDHLMVRKDLTLTHKLVVNMIEVRLQYLDLKYLW